MGLYLILNGGQELMYISKVIIENFKCFKGRFTLDLNKHLNIIVGDNEAGKSTIIQAINLALTGIIDGKYLKVELNQYLFNQNVVGDYLSNINSGSQKNLQPPSILIEVYLEDIQDDAVKALFEGNGNSEQTKACGIGLKIELSETYKELYEELVNSSSKLNSLPIEYYDFIWSSFARDESLTPSKIPLKPALIDSSGARNSNGSDLYISRILHEYLENSDKISVSQAHRNLRDSFDSDQSIDAINKKINKAIDISDKKIKLSVDVSSKNAWETTLSTFFDGIPFQYIGKGEQVTIKTKLALSHKKTVGANVLLVEEPENHLSHSKLSKLIKFISNSNKEKQIIVSTHSSFVANKLNLGNIILLNLNTTSKSRIRTSFNDLSAETKKFFEKLPGYDSLRLILCKSAILVEGDSDELVVQKAFSDLKNKGLPIENDIEVISVGTAFLRFLEIATKLEKRVAVITDNDGDISALESKYDEYLGKNDKASIFISFDHEVDTGALTIGKNSRPFNYNTLEPKFLKANSVVLLNKILGTSFTTPDELHIHMHANKTESALKVFESSEEMEFPEYIVKAIEFIENGKK